MNSINLRKETAKILLLVIFGAVILAAFSGCDDNGGITIPSGATQLSISMKSQDNLFDNPQDEIIITEAKALVSTVDFDIDGGNGSKERMEIGMFVMNFNLDGSLKQVTNGYIIKDNVTNIKIQIHKPEESETPSDAEFKDGPADNQRYSFIIKGTYNGNNFVYKSKKSTLVTIDFAKTLDINLAQMNVTVLFDKLNWFKNAAAILNPSLSQNENLIDDNIKNSFKQAFLDDDDNGQPDN
jgi:hypothetical protein